MNALNCQRNMLEYRIHSLQVQNETFIALNVY